MFVCSPQLVEWEKINDRLNLHRKDGRNKGKGTEKVCKFKRSNKLTHYGK